MRVADLAPYEIQHRVIRAAARSRMTQRRDNHGIETRIQEGKRSGQHV